MVHPGDDAANRSKRQLAAPRVGAPLREGLVPMSDVAGGPGWWQASDGKWYPPQPPSGPPGPPPIAPPPFMPTPSMPPPALPTKSDRPWWKKKRFIIPGVLLLLIVAAGLAGPPEEDEEGSSGGDASGVTTDDETTTTTEQEAGEETTTTAEPTTTSTSTTLPPTTTTIPPPIVHEGVGDAVIEIALPEPRAPAVATISHGGSSNFAVFTLDSNFSQTDLLVNEIGNYAGTVAIDFQDSGTAGLEITADGPWRIELKSLLLVRTESGAFTGTGDDVVFYDGPSGPVAVTHDGASNFALFFYGGNSGPSLMVNEIGPYTGTVAVRDAPGFIVVTADGNWSVTPG